jgi:O-antigen ligase
MAILEKTIFASLVLLLLLTPLPYGTVEAWSTAAWELWVFATALLWAALAAKRGRLSIAANPLIWPLLALLLLALAQALPLAPGRRALSFDPYATLQAAIKLLALMLFFLLFSTFVNTDERRRLIVELVIALVFLIALVGIGQSYVGKALWQRGALGPFVNRNHFAGFLEMGFGLAAALVVSRSVRRELLAIYACMVLVLCAGLAVSGSRGGFLALMAEAIFLALLAWPARAASGERRSSVLARIGGVVTLFAVTVVGAMLLVGSDGLVHSLSQLQTEVQTEMPASERVNRREIWRATIKMIKDHPVIGVGLGAYPLAYTRYDPSSGYQRVEQSHNDYLQIIADAGLLGGLIALWFVALLFGRGFAAAERRDRQSRAVILGSLTGCFAIAVHSFASSSSVYDSTWRGTWSRRSAMNLRVSGLRGAYSFSTAAVNTARRCRRCLWTVASAGDASRIRRRTCRSSGWPISSRVSLPSTGRAYPSVAL